MKGNYSKLLKSIDEEIRLLQDNSFDDEKFIENKKFINVLINHFKNKKLSKDVREKLLKHIANLLDIIEKKEAFRPEPLRKGDKPNKPNKNRINPTHLWDVVFMGAKYEDDKTEESLKAYEEYKKANPDNYKTLDTYTKLHDEFIKYLAWQRNQVEAWVQAYPNRNKLHDIEEEFNKEKDKAKELLKKKKVDDNQDSERLKNYLDLFRNSNINKKNGEDADSSNENNVSSKDDEGVVVSGSEKEEDDDDDDVEKKKSKKRSKTVEKEKGKKQKEGH